MKRRKPPWQAPVKRILGKEVSNAKALKLGRGKSCQNKKKARLAGVKVKSGTNKVSKVGRPPSYKEAIIGFFIVKGCIFWGLENPTLHAKPGPLDVLLNKVLL